jgi:uncharacterized protein (DUF302 family)
MAQGPELSDVVELPSGEAFAATLERLVTTIEAAGLRIFARIDHAAGAVEVGMAMPPAVLLLYGHPKGGTPIMLDTPAAALDLPLRVLVRENSEGHTLVSFHPVVPMLSRAGVDEALARRLEPAQQLLVDAIRT